MEYGKIETLFERDKSTHKVLPDRVRLLEFSLVTQWHVTEKIDGTNIRIQLLGDTVRFAGRTDRAQIPTPLLRMLQEKFPPAAVSAAFEPGVSAVIYGEGYGPGIQASGKHYRKDPGFRVFDVAIVKDQKVWWLNWSQVEDVAAKIGAKTVPVLATGVSLDQAVDLVALPSRTAEEDGGNTSFIQEGIVARTDPLLLR